MTLQIYQPDKSNSNQKIIEIKNATVYRDQTRVFKDLSLEISQKCNTAILGPNGAGKTTLLKLLSRDIYPVHRSNSYIKLLGKELWDVWELRAHLGIVSQDLQQQYAGHARGSNVILSGFYSSINTYSHQQFSSREREHAQFIMDMMGVAELKDRPFSLMSTGEQRRFLLGRALVHDPHALILDEPTSGLDLKACFQYLNLVRGLMRNGKTIILVTHHIHEIPPEISRVVLLKGGRVLADGDKTEVLTDAKLSNLFETPVHLVQANGFYQALPSTVEYGNS